MKITSNTSKTSSIGVAFISCWASASTCAPRVSSDRVIGSSDVGDIGEASRPTLRHRAEERDVHVMGVLRSDELGLVEHTVSEQSWRRSAYVRRRWAGLFLAAVALVS